MLTLQDMKKKKKNTQAASLYLLLWCVSAVTGNQVAFLAKRIRVQHPPYAVPIIFAEVVTNQGDGYNNTSGYFTAPYSGTYFFIATCGSLFRDVYAGFDLFVEHRRINYVFSHNNDGFDTFATAHGIVHLYVGQRVWVRSSGAGYNTYASFSGLLISADS